MPAQVIGGRAGRAADGRRSSRCAPGRYRIRFTSLTAAGDIIDRWIQSQTVPDLSNEPLVLSTPRFLRARNMIEFRAIEANPDAVADRVDAIRPHRSRAGRNRMRRRRDGETPTIKVELLNAKGDVLRRLDAPPLADGKLRMPLPVGKPRQQHLRSARSTATSGEQRAEQWVAFRVAR